MAVMIKCGPAFTNQAFQGGNLTGVQLRKQLSDYPFCKVTVFCDGVMNEGQQVRQGSNVVCGVDFF